MTDPSLWYVFTTKSEAEEFAARFLVKPAAASSKTDGKRPLSTLSKPAKSVLSNCLNRQWAKKSGTAAKEAPIESSFAKKAKKFAPIVARKSAMTAKIDALLEEYGSDDLSKMQARLDALDKEVVEANEQHEIRLAEKT